MKYRPHRGSLEDAMREARTIANIDDLVAIINEGMAPFGAKVSAADVQVRPYGFDNRIGWNTHIVTVRNKANSAGEWWFGADMGPDYFGAVGFTDSPVITQPESK